MDTALKETRAEARAKMDVTAILVNYNTAELLPEAVGRLRAAGERMSLKVVIVDNASRDNSIEVLQRDFSDCHVIVNKVNVGFGRANNQGLPLAEGRYVLLLNTDAFVSPDTLDETVAYMDAHPACGILGVKLVGRDGSLQPSARFFPTPWNLFLMKTGLDRVFTGVRMVDDMEWDHASVRECDWVPGCYYLVRKEVIDQVGLFDPRFFLYYEEVDHCLAAKRAGWKVVFYPHCKVIHLGGESAKSEGEVTRLERQIESIQIESELLYFRKNHGITGVWAHMLLTFVGDAMVGLRQLLRRKSAQAARRWAKRDALVWALFWRTRWATHPTR
jgi:GT2 family glycosyltransferase